MPCFPGFTPVKMLVHAGGDSGGTVELRVRTTLLDTSLRRLGVERLDTSGAIMLQLAPSIPIKISFLLKSVNLLADLSSLNLSTVI